MADMSTQVPRGERSSSSQRASWIKVLVITLLVTIPAFLLGHVIWHPMGMAPSPGQMPFFMGVSFVEALALGLGVSFLVFGLPLVRTLTVEDQSVADVLGPRLGLGLLVASRQPAHEQRGEHAEAFVHRVRLPRNPGNQRCHRSLLLFVATAGAKQRRRPFWISENRM